MGAPTSFDIRPHVAVIAVRPHTSTARRARRAVTRVCDGSFLPAQLVDDASRVAVELVANSLRQTHHPAELSITLTCAGLLVRVRERAAPGGEHSPGAILSWNSVRQLSASFGFSYDGEQRQTWALLRPAPPPP